LKFKKRIKAEEFLQLILKGINPNTDEIISKNSVLKDSQFLKEIIEFMHANRYDTVIIKESDIIEIKKSDLFQLLRKQRLKISNKLGWKPYHILSDNALVRLIIYSPKTLQEAARIKYIGAKNIENVPSFIEIIKKYKCKEMGELKNSCDYYEICVDCGIKLDFNYRSNYPERDRCSKCYRYENNNRMSGNDFKGSFNDWEEFNNQNSIESSQRNNYGQSDW
tara:strand:+ start:630 stop:1295 length:666 start_codon:yes stop_codon:yes gene_type:complete